MFYVPETLSFSTANPKIKLFYVLVIQQCFGVAIHDDSAIFEDITIMAITQCHIGILFCQQESDLLFLIELLHDFADFFNQSRRQPHRGFIKQYHFRPSHQSPSHCCHLLLPARGISGSAVTPILEAREVTINQFQIPADRRRTIGTCERTS